MKAVVCAGALVCALAVIPATCAFAQCRGGGGGGQTAAVAATSGSGTTTVASGQLLTSPARGPMT